MILFTILGRVQTKLITYILLVVLTLLFVSVTSANEVWTLFAIALSVGLILEILWGVLVTYQPGWLVWVFGLVEFAVITAIATTLEVPITLGWGATYFWSTWVIIQLFLIYILPVIKPSWSDMGGELL